MEFREMMPEMKGTLEAFVLADDGTETPLFAVRNTIVSGFYTHLWDIIAEQDKLGYVDRFALGDDATPTNFADTALGNLLYQQTPDSVVRTDYRLTVTTTMEKTSGNGNTYYEAGCYGLWATVGGGAGVYRLLARAIFRDPAGAILGIEKNGQRILFRWHFDREGLA